MVIGLALVGTPVAAYATEPTATQPTSSTTAATTSAQAEAQQSNAQTETVIGSADEEQATAQEGAAPTAPTAVNNATITSDLTPCVASDASGSTTVDGTASASQAGTESTTTDPSPADDAATSSDTSQSEASPSVTTDVDVYGKGHQTASDGQVAGSAGAGEKIDSLTLHVASPDGTSYSDADVEYRAHVEGTGWDARWTSGGNAVGTAGSGKRIEALQIRLREGSDLAKDWQLWARAYVQNHGWLAPWLARLDEHRPGGLHGPGVAPRGARAAPVADWRTGPHRRLLRRLRLHQRRVLYRRHAGAGPGAPRAGESASRPSRSA